MCVKQHRSEIDYFHVLCVCVGRNNVTPSSVAITRRHGRCNCQRNRFRRCNQCCAGTLHMRHSDHLQQIDINGSIRHDECKRDFLREENQKPQLQIEWTKATAEWQESKQFSGSCRWNDARAQFCKERCAKQLNRPWFEANGTLHTHIAVGRAAISMCHSCYQTGTEVRRRPSIGMCTLRRELIQNRLCSKGFCRYIGGALYDRSNRIGHLRTGDR